MSSIKVESWTWYSLVLMLVIARLTSRTLLRQSVKNLQIDDALMCLGFGFYTTLIVVVNILSHTGTNLMRPDEKMNLTEADRRHRATGSKLVVVAEECQINAIWLVKCCLLLMYSRLTRRTRFKICVKVVAAYVLIAYLVMQILYLGVWCRPFSQYWAVPTENVQCNAQVNELITNVSFNISSDLMILALPMPVVLHTQLPLKKKLILCGIFCLGLFTVISAALNKYYSFHDPFSIMWTFWYIRESSTAFLVANIPFTWTLFQRVFKLRSWAESSEPRIKELHTPRSDDHHQGVHIKTETIIELEKCENDGASSKQSPSSRWYNIDHPDINLPRSDSQELINRAQTPPDHTASKSVDSNDSSPLEIWHNVDYSVTSNSLGYVPQRHGEEPAVLQGKTRTSISALDAVYQPSHKEHAQRKSLKFGRSV